MPLRIFRRHPHQQAALGLYNGIVAQARRAVFYTALGVADTVDGRFDLIALHAFLVMRRLGRGGAEARALSQALFDIMFADMDQNLREMGVGDLGVGTQVKHMAKAFFGRISAYEAALAVGDPALEQALGRNLYRGATPGEAQLTAMARYLRRQDAALAAQAEAALLAGRVAFGDPEEEAT